MEVVQGVGARGQELAGAWCSLLSEVLVRGGRCGLLLLGLALGRPLLASWERAKGWDGERGKNGGFCGVFG